LAIASFGGLRPAHAWVCSRVADNYGNSSGAGLVWADRTVSYVFNDQGTGKLDNGAAQSAIDNAFATWSQSTLRDSEPADCTGLIDTSVVSATATDMVFNRISPDTTQSSVGYNYLEPERNENVILFRDDTWRYPLSGPPADIIAMTTLTYNVITGAILDADIEFNTATFDFTTGDDAVVYDVQNTATHEVGHLLGFAHSLDQNATMYSSADKGETTKRALSCDDATILWYRYPAGAETNSCKLGQVSKLCGNCAHAGGLAYSAKLRVLETHDGQGGCSCHSLDAGGALGLVALSLASIGRIRRQRRV
jgi:hypothetical protein